MEESVIEALAGRTGTIGNHVCKAELSNVI